jgi:hypothetical protein
MGVGEITRCSVHWPGLAQEKDKWSSRECHNRPSASIKESSGSKTGGLSSTAQLHRVSESGLRRTIYVTKLAPRDKRP